MNWKGPPSPIHPPSPITKAYQMQLQIARYGLSPKVHLFYIPEWRAMNVGITDIVKALGGPGAQRMPASRTATKNVTRRITRTTTAKTIYKATMMAPRKTIYKATMKAPRKNSLDALRRVATAAGVKVQPYVDGQRRSLTRVQILHAMQNAPPRPSRQFVGKDELRRECRKRGLAPQYYGENGKRRSWTRPEMLAKLAAWSNPETHCQSDSNLACSELMLC